MTKKNHLTFRAVFSDETGLSCAMKLDDLPVHFSDLFNPLQVPAHFKVSNAWLSFRNVHCRYVPRLATSRALVNPSIPLKRSERAICERRKKPTGQENSGKGLLESLQCSVLTICVITFSVGLERRITVHRTSKYFQL